MSQTGIVQRFNKIKGYGFILSDGDNQEIFVHYSEILSEGYKELIIGQRVSYTLKNSEKGAYAAHVQVLKF